MPFSSDYHESRATVLRRPARRLTISFACACLAGCSPSDAGSVTSGTSMVGAQGEGGADSSAAHDGGTPTPNRIDAGKAPPDRGCGVLEATVRDFRSSHPDFENDGFGARNLDEAMRAVPGLVERQLGSDRKPVFRSDGRNAPEPARPSLTDADSFAQWYRDTDGVNISVPVQLTLTPTAAGSYVFDSNAFFPVDGMGFGSEPAIDQGRHNFHFTTEIHLRFLYESGQVLTFRGDDDLWLFVNDTLALDLGGLHLPVEASLNLDALATELGILPGEIYRMDIFHAERHTEQSNFRIETSIECLWVEII